MAGALFKICRGGQTFFFSDKPSVSRRAIKTSVWWDVNDCQDPSGWVYYCKLPKDCGPAISGNITKALSKLNYSAPVTFSAYVDRNTTGLELEQSLSNTGIKLTHVPTDYCDKNRLANYSQILMDLYAWTKDNPAPANCLIISSDVGLTYALHRLGMKGYNILLAKPRNVSRTMEAAAKTLWRWKSLRAGGPPEWTRN